MRVVPSGLILACVLCGPALAAEPLKPNLIVIYTDDHGWSDLGAQGVQKDVRTPHLDELAAGGVRATNGYVTAPQCVPSRGGLLVGKFQGRFNLDSNGSALDGFNQQTTIATRLQNAGYATGMSGKWHLGPQEQITRHGFADVYCNQGAGGKAWANFDLEGNTLPGAVVLSPLYHLEANAAAACAFIRRHHDQPFFFYLAFRAPHVPLDPPQSYLDRFPGEMPERRRKALAMISAMDDGVGLIQKTLRELKLEERTLIFLIGDNGAPLKITKEDAPGSGPGWDGSLNEPMNGEKGMLSEGGMRVPFIVSWPGTITPGQAYRHPVIALDVAATAVALAGLPADKMLDGVNLVPFLTGKETGAPHERLFWRWTSQAAVREGKWKYLRGGSREYLFDLDADPGEKQNLLAANPETARGLSAKLDAWGAELQPPGIEKKSLSATGSNYFDHYLDGKPVAKPKPTPQTAADADAQRKAKQQRRKKKTANWSMPVTAIIVAIA